MIKVNPKNNIISGVNIYVLNYNHKIIFTLLFLILMTFSFYIYFLFMSVSYTYSIKFDSEKLNLLATKNAKKQIMLFDKEKKVGRMLAANFVKIDKINYVRTDDVLVMNIRH